MPDPEDLLLDWLKLLIPLMLAVGGMIGAIMSRRASIRDGDREGGVITRTVLGTIAGVLVYGFLLSGAVSLVLYMAALSS